MLSLMVFDLLMYVVMMLFDLIRLMWCSDIMLSLMLFDLT
jgi:hypothetical protein